TIPLEVAMVTGRYRLLRHFPTSGRMPLPDAYTFSTVSILLLDLAESLDDKPRHLAMAIYRMSELGLMLVERSLDNEKAIKTT
ncbi:hypothetical protein ACVK1X_004855, partial [Pseudomonas sp. PvR086]